MAERPLVTVGGLIIAQDGEIFLVRSKKWNDLYSLPGGKVEWGETREEAFRREVKEETGLIMRNIRFALVQDCIFSPEFWQTRHFVMNDFIAELDPSCSKKSVILNDEAYEFCWIKPAEALALPLHRECRYLIEWYLSQKTQKRGKIGFEHHHVCCTVGVHPLEKEKKQDLYFDVKVEISFDPCAISDHLYDTIDYTQLAAICTELAQERHYALLEKLASDILDRMFRLFPLTWAWIRIKKPAAIPTASYAIVELEKKLEG